MWGYHDGMGWWMVFGGMWMLVFWAVVVGAAVWGVRRLAVGGRHGPIDADSPIEIARRRLARGEISREQYDDLIETLQQ